MTDQSVTFAGLRAKLGHHSHHPSLVECPACYAERLEKAFEELRDELKNERHPSTPISETENRIAKRLTSLIGKVEEGK